jgi:hypothetical protein
MLAFHPFNLSSEVLVDVRLTQPERRMVSYCLTVNFSKMEHTTKISTGEEIFCSEAESTTA